MYAGALGRAGSYMTDESQCEESFGQYTSVISCCDTEACNSGGTNQPLIIVSAVALPSITLKIIFG